jgi:hypothetical protein
MKNSDFPNPYFGEICTDIYFYGDDGWDSLGVIDLNSREIYINVKEIFKFCKVDHNFPIEGILSWVIIHEYMHSILYRDIGRDASCKLDNMSLMLHMFVREFT